MRLIIAGGRDFEDWELFKKSMETFSTSEIECVLSGHCPTGADRMGEEWARMLSIPVEIYPANWTKYGKRAGYVRNREMAEHADALVAFWDGASRGTKLMIDLATELKLVVYTQRYGAGRTP